GTFEPGTAWRMGVARGGGGVTAGAGSGLKAMPGSPRKLTDGVSPVAGERSAMSWPLGVVSAAWTLVTVQPLTVVSPEPKKVSVPEKPRVGSAHPVLRLGLRPASPKASGTGSTSDWRKGAPAA